MVRIGSPPTGLVLLCILLAGALAGPSLGNINLELRPETQIVIAGNEARVGLYAVSDDASNQTTAAADVIFAWDPTYLDLLGVDNTGAATALFSGFPAADPYSLNESVPPQDGDGLYQMFARLGMPISATPAGTLLTTFRFTALALTPGTPIDVLATGGNPPGNTIVYDGVTPNTDVTGTLDGGTVIIIPEPASLALAAFGALALLGSRGRRTRRSEG